MVVIKKMYLIRNKKQNNYLEKIILFEKGKFTHFTKDINKAYRIKYKKDLNKIVKRFNHFEKFEILKERKGVYYVIEN